MSYTGRFFRQRIHIDSRQAVNDLFNIDTSNAVTTSTLAKNLHRLSAQKRKQDVQKNDAQGATRVEFTIET